jgi:hypothetical protein
VLFSYCLIAVLSVQLMRLVILGIPIGFSIGAASGAGVMWYHTSPSRRYSWIGQEGETEDANESL